MLLRQCASTWLQVDFDRKYDVNQGNVHGALWHPEQPLRDALAAMFPRYENPAVDGSTLPVGEYISHANRWAKSNTALTFTSWGYFKIEWTDCLQDHLALADCVEGELPTIFIFHQASYLQHSQCANEFLPPGLIEETMCTLGLLMNSTNKRTRNWFSKEAQRGKHS